MALEHHSTWDEASARANYGRNICLLSRDDGWALQDALVKAFSRQEFQSKLHAAWKTAAGNSAKQTKARQQICMEVQGPILKRYGFEASFDGLMDCYMAFGPELKTDPEIAMTNQHLVRLTNPGVQADMGPAAFQGEVRIWTLGDDGTYQLLETLSVDLADDVQSLREQLATRTGIPDLAQQLSADGRTLHGRELLGTIVPSHGVAELLLLHRQPEVVEWLTLLGAVVEKKAPIPFLKGTSPEILADAIYMFPAVERYGKALQFARGGLDGDRAVALAAVQQDGLALEHVAPALLADAEVVLAAVRQDPWSFEFAAPELKADRGMVLAAVQECGWVIAHATPDLQKDTEVVLAAVRQDWEVLEDVAAELRADRALMLAAVRENGNCLQFAAPELKADREVVLMAVQTTGQSICFAAFNLQEDPEVVGAAVRQSWEVLPLLPSEVRDFELGMAAAKQSLLAIQFLPLDMKARVAKALGVKGVGSEGQGAKPPELNVVDKGFSRLRKHFATLGLHENAQPDAIKKCYRRLALENHPDKHPEDVDGAKKRFQLVNNAYRTLKEQLGF